MEKFNLYFLQNGESKHISDLSLDQAVTQTRLLLLMGAEITGIINVKED